jgi:hypothetical protein
MSTRGLYGFVADGELRVVYNHSDSYPDALGEDVVRFARELIAEGPAAVAAAKEKVKALRVIADEMSVPTPADVEALAPWTKLYVDRRHDDGTPSWYQLTRGTQGDPRATLESGYIIDATPFGHDSLFCEWGYVIDFDAEAIEVYQGLQTEQPKAGRWADHTPESEYGSINMILKVAFSGLSSDDVLLSLIDTD